MRSNTRLGIICSIMGLAIGGGFAWWGSLSNEKQETIAHEENHKPVDPELTGVILRAPEKGRPFTVEDRPHDEIIHAGIEPAD